MSPSTPHTTVSTTFGGHTPKSTTRRSNKGRSPFRHGQKKKKGISPRGKGSKELTAAELRDKLERELKQEESELVWQKELGEKAAAVSIQSVQRGGGVRNYEQERAKLAGSITLQSVMRGHSNRRKMDPNLYPVEDEGIDISNSAALMLKKLEEDSLPMLKLEDRNVIMWETEGTVDLELEKLKKRGRILKGPEPPEPPVVIEDKKAEMNKQNSVLSAFLNEAADEADDEENAKEEKKDDGIKVDNDETSIVSEDTIKTFDLEPTSWEAKVVSRTRMHKNAVNNANFKLTDENMLSWLGKGLPGTKIPLDKEIRERKREEKHSIFTSFVNQTLDLLNDFEEREKLIARVGEVKERVRDMIYKDERDFQDCHFRDQLRHEYLHEKPLVSQRKFQESVDAYKRDEKELKILMATIRRIDKFDCTLLSCKLIKAHIDDNWAHQIAKAIRGNDFLQQLYLNQNYITDAGVQSLANALRDNWALKIINLAGNFITDEGAFAIAEMLEVNKHLVELNLEFREKKRPYRDKDKPYPTITAPGGSSIAFALQGNFSLTSLSFEKQKLWDAGAAAVAMTLKRNKTLRYLNLAENDISDPGGLALGAALLENKGLHHFKVSSNRFSDKVAISFADAIRGNDVIETLDLFCNDFTVDGIRQIREATQLNETLRVVSVYGARGIKDASKRNDPVLDNLIASNIRKYREDKHIKNMVIWHKRLFKLGESRRDYDHFLEVQFSVIKDDVTGQLFDVDESKLEYRNSAKAHAEELGIITVQPQNPMSQITMRLRDSKVLATAPTREPRIFMDIWDEDLDGITVESRLWEAWLEWTAKDEAEASLGDVNVKAYNDSTNPFYDSLTRLMQLRIPLPGKPLQEGTISICRLQFLKEEETFERRKMGREYTYRLAKKSALDWNDHIHASVNLPPDKFVEREYQSSFPHKYPDGIDAMYNRKGQKLDAILSSMAGKTIVKYKGMTDEEHRQKQMDEKIQAMALEGKDSKDRKIALRLAGAQKIMTSDQRTEQEKSPPKPTTMERKKRFSKAHIGAPTGIFRDRAKTNMMRTTKEKQRAEGAKIIADRKAYWKERGERRGGVASGFI